MFRHWPHAVRFSNHLTIAILFFQIMGFSVGQQNRTELRVKRVREKEREMSACEIGKASRWHIFGLFWSVQSCGFNLFTFRLAASSTVSAHNEIIPSINRFLSKESFFFYYIMLFFSIFLTHLLYSWLCLCIRSLVNNRKYRCGVILKLT